MNNNHLNNLNNQKPEANEQEQQVFDAINKANRVLIVLPAHPNGDAVGAGLALFGFIKKLDKEPEIVCSGQDLRAFSFLPEHGAIKNELSIFQSFVISVNTANAKLEELSYETRPSRVDIFLKPESGKFNPADVSFRNARFPYDLILTVAAPSLDNLGEVYEKNTDLFFETPVVNIDHHPGNEYYGEINLVDLAATSTAEIAAELIEDFESSLIDSDIATNLLTGIIVETNSFQHTKTTPKAFLRASNLISLGGAHQDIIRELYKTKSIALLKLWGRALARIKEVPELGLTYSLVNAGDLEKTGGSAGEVVGVMREMIANLSGRKIILFLAETAPNQVVGYFHLHPSIKSQVVAAALAGQMLNGTVGKFTISNKPLLDVEKETLEKLKKIQNQLSV